MAANDHEIQEASREAFTMALYLSLVLSAEFVVADDYVRSTRSALGIVWGTALGLTVAHVFAFGLASRLFAGGDLPNVTRTSITWQIGIALILATVLSIPFLVADVSTAFNVDSVLIAGFIGIIVYLVARSAGSTRGRGMIDAAVMIVLALAVVAVKAALKG